MDSEQLKHMIIKVAPKVLDNKYYTFCGEEEDTPKLEKNTTYRQSVLVIVEHPNQHSYLGVNSKERNYLSFITGGIHSCESVEQAAKREISEESGYFDFEFITNLQFSILNYFYAKNSGVNKLVKYNIVYAKLASLKNKRNIGGGKAKAYLHLAT